jgi:hypothetical protein
MVPKFSANLAALVHISRGHESCTESHTIVRRAEESAMPTIVIDEIARRHNGESKDLQINPY